MASASKAKKQRSTPSVPCEVFFACTLCGFRSRTVPQLYTHYRATHKGELNTKPKSREKDIISMEDDDVKGKASPPPSSSPPPASVAGETSSKVSSPASDENSPSKGSTSDLGSNRGKKRKTSSDLSKDRQDKSPSADGKAASSPSCSESSGSEERSAKSPKTGGKSPKIEWKDCVTTRKRNVPLGMLKGKKNSLMVIFQHADQTKPLPEGSAFKLRNTGGEQTYLVVANVDVDIIESVHRRPVVKNR